MVAAKALKIELLAAGTKPPAWIQEGVKEYQKRLPRECSLDIKEIAIAKRGKNNSINKYKLEEQSRMLQHIKKGARVVAMDVTGSIWSTELLSKNLAKWMQSYGQVQLLVGGPDGLSAECLARADEVWSLSRLTFPHFLVRVLIAEQLYRAWSLLNNHPYHK